MHGFICEVEDIRPRGKPKKRSEVIERLSDPTNMQGRWYGP